MFRVPESTPIEQLNTAVAHTAENIGQFVKRPGDFTRNRKLNAETTLRVVLNMQGNSINAELLAAFPNLADRMTASAFEQAKDKLSPEVFSHLLTDYNATNSRCKRLDGKYRLYAIDGSDFSVPFDKNSEYVVTSSLGRPKKNGEDAKPFSMLHANILFNLLDRTYEDCIIQSKMQTQERMAAVEMLKRLPDEDYIVIMDRGYDGFNMIEHCNKLPACHYIIRTKTGGGGIREIAALPNRECDRDVEFKVTTSGHYYQKNKNKQSLHWVQHANNHYKDSLSENTKNRQWDHHWLVNIKCRDYRIHCNDPPNRVFLEIGSYINPVREGRSDKRNLKPKSAIWFIYRVA